MEEQIKSQVRNSFTKLRNAIDLREKLLLRQLEAFVKFSQKSDLSEINFVINNEEDILAELRTYGSYQNIETFLPFLENENEEEGQNEDVKCLTSDLVTLDNKLSESIINLTVQESKDLITKSGDLKLKTDNLVSQVQKKLNIVLPNPSSFKQNSDIDKTSESNMKDVKSTKQTAKDVKAKESESKLKRGSSKKKVLKNISNLTLNSCGTGNIILKNISNLTINTSCKKPESEIDSRVCKDSKCEIFSPQCDFYEKLITENEALKKTIVHQSLNCTTFPDPITAVCMSPKNPVKNDGTFSINSVTNDTSASSIIEEAEDGFPAAAAVMIEKARKSDIGFITDSPIEEISTRNMQFADNFGDHSPIIQCWLNKMCLETELENNIEILEFSNIVS